MNNLLRRISIFSWPIWLKLLVGFVVAVVLPLSALAAFMLTSIQQAGRHNVELYISETGVRQWEYINSAFVQAQNTIDDFVADDDHYQSLRRLLPFSAGTTVRAEDKGAMIDVLQSGLLNRPDSPFEKVEVINNRGQLVIQALPGRGRELSPNEDRTATSAYQAALNAQLLGNSQTIATSIVNDQPVIELVHIIRLPPNISASREVAGYLVATINVSNVIYNNLQASGNFFNANSYLVSPAGVLITSAGSQLIPPSQAQRLLNGEENLGGFSGEIVRYDAPIAGTNFRLFTEGAGDVVAAEILAYLTPRGFALFIGLIALVGVLVVGINYLLTPPLGRLRDAMQAMARGNFNAPLADLQRGDEIGAVAASFADMRLRVQGLIDDLESRIESRTRDITATQEISHYAATERDLQRLLDRVVNLITERFPNIYHAQIFLIDLEHRYAVLRASTGEPGRRLLERGHRLEIGSISVIGQVTELGEVVIARDTAESNVHRRNPFLPDTLAELAIPLRVSGDRIIGALDVQSKQSETFSEDQVAVLQTMADQIAVAIENARLYQESLRRLEEIERTRRAATLQAWREYMKQERARLKHSEAGLRPAQSPSPALRQEAIQQGRPVIGAVTERNTIPVAVPIRLRDQVLGVVEWELPQESFDPGRLQLAEELTGRLALSLENARLFQESQQATDRERLVNEIAARLTSQTDIDQILQTAVREVGQALRAPQVSIRLNQDNTNGKNGHTPNGHAKTGKLSRYHDDD